MKIASVILCVLFLTIHLSAQSVADAPRLLSYEIVKSYTQEDLQKKWKESGIPKSIAPIRYDVDIFEIIYTTCWHDSTCIKASGLYFLPKNANKPPMLVYHHGTQIEKERKLKLGGEIAICMGYATDGYAVLFPDYIGLGKGEKFHLYHHIKTEAYASIDLIRAVRILNAEKGFQMGNQLFATGYSQGGHATMAFQKVVEADPELHKEFKITASAPMSGAYDLTGVQEKNMFELYSHPGYLPYLLVGFQESYQLYENLNTVLASPYDVSILPLFDGNHSMGEVNKAMPKIPKDVFKPEIVEEYLSNENFPFKVALRENSTHRWVPKVPMMLCYCEGDEQVNYMNSVVAYKSMKSLGAKHIRLKRVSKNMNHRTCALYSVLYSKMFFDSFVSGSKYGRKGPLSKRMLISIGIKQMMKNAKKKAKKKS